MCVGEGGSLGSGNLFRPFYTMRCFTHIFFFLTVLMLVSKKLVKTREKREKITQHENICLYYTTRWVKNASWLHFFFFSFSCFGTFEVTKTQTQSLV